MAEWQRHLYLNPEWQQCVRDEITLQECAASIAAKLRAIEPFYFSDRVAENILRENLADRLDKVIGETDADYAVFNSIMSDLWDWGDRGNTCWIQTDDDTQEEAA